MMKQEHIVFSIIFFIIVIIAEAIIIFSLIKENREKNYGESELSCTVPKLRKFWGAFVVYVVSTSIIALFVASFILDTNITLQDMNNWVSLILGMVALIIGVISLFLSFYNVDESIRSQEKSIEIMNTVQKDIDRKLVEMEKSFQQGFQKLHEEYLHAHNIKSYPNGTIEEKDWVD